MARIELMTRDRRMTMYVKVATAELRQRKVAICETVVSKIGSVGKSSVRHTAL